MTLPIKPKNKYTLPAYGTWKPSVHVFDERTINALIAAWLSERPLLVRGDPGTGKSQLARAAAVALNWEFVSEVVSAHTDIQDLWYRFDAVSRLGQAQLLSAFRDKLDPEALKAELDPRKFLSPGALWWAYDWKTAQEYYRSSDFKLYHPNPQQEQKWEAAQKLGVDGADESGEKFAEPELPKGVVLLIDEIDKADADLPNSLLETLDNARFRVPWVNDSIGYRADNKDAIRPLVVITTNEDRELPPAFVRRCLVLNLELPEKEEELISYLIQRGEEHFTNEQDQPVFSSKVMTTAAQQLHKDRQEAIGLGFKPPGQAEYLDLLRVLSRMELDEASQLEMLGQIQDFALKKHPGMKQKIHTESATGEGEDEA